MKLFILTFIFTTLLFSCNHKSSRKIDDIKKSTENAITTQLIPDTIIYEFIKSALPLIEGKEHRNCKIILDKETPLKGYSFSKEDSLALIKNEAHFKDKDLEFIFKQIGNADNFRLNKLYIAGKTIVNIDSLYSVVQKIYEQQSGRNRIDLFWGIYYQRYGHNCFCTIGVPLFSLDMKTVILRFSIACAPLNGRGATYIFKKTNEKWGIISQYADWIS